MWPSSGFCIAARAAGETLQGPGPHSSRSGGLAARGSQSCGELSCAKPGHPSTAFYALDKFIQICCAPASGARTLLRHEAHATRLHRSELAVPGSNVRMLEKAPKLGADIVMLDLEDAVAPDDKPQARTNVIAALNELDWSGC